MEIDSVGRSFDDCCDGPIEDLSVQYLGRNWKVEEQFQMVDLSQYLAWGRWEDLGDFERVERGRVPSDNPRVQELRREADEHDNRAKEHERNAWEAVFNGAAGTVIREGIESYGELFKCAEKEQEANRLANEDKRH